MNLGNTLGRLEGSLTFGHLLRAQGPEHFLAFGPWAPCYACVGPLPGLFFYFWVDVEPPGRSSEASHKTWIKGYPLTLNDYGTAMNLGNCFGCLASVDFITIGLSSTIAFSCWSKLIWFALGFVGVHHLCWFKCTLAWRWWCWWWWCKGTKCLRGQCSRIATIT